MKSNLLFIIGIVMTVTGFAAIFSRSTYFLPPTEPPVMRPLEGIEYLVVLYPQAFLFIGMVGIAIIIIIAGIIVWRKKK